MAPRQKQALFQLVYLTWAFGGFGCLFVLPTSLNVPQWIQISLLVVFVVAAPFAIYSWWRCLTRQDTEEDERDRMIMSKVSEYQNYATMLTLLGWMLFYVFSYNRDDEIPHMLVPLMIGTIGLVIFLVRTAGVLVAYWLANRSVIRP